MVDVWCGGWMCGVGAGCVVRWCGWCGLVRAVWASAAYFCVFWRMAYLAPISISVFWRMAYSAMFASVVYPDVYIYVYVQEWCIPMYTCVCVCVCVCV